MKDADCVAFLHWALPRLGLNWRGFRKVRRQVCRRIACHIKELGLGDAAAYRERLASDQAEWQALAALCTIPISRFYRDPSVFDRLGSVVLPALAERARRRGQKSLECWSAGCASGEEPYTVAILWRMLLASRFSALSLRVLGTDVDASLLERARAGCYKASSLKALPPGWRDQAFERRGDLFCLPESWRAGLRFERQDLLSELPQGSFDLVLCRNLAFTYFDAERARQALDRLTSRLRLGSALVVGIHERLPEPAARLEPWADCQAIFRLSSRA
jgi:chemotaxis protein methyltransferase CheR